MRTLLTFFSLALLLVSIQAVTVQLPPSNELFCLFKDVNEGQKFVGTYVVSGYNEKDVAVLVQSPLLDDPLYENEKQREGSWEVDAKISGEYRACFRNEASTEAYITVDLVTKQEQGNLPITEKDMGMFEIHLRDVDHVVNMIEANLDFQDIRGNIHSKNMEKMESKVHWSAFFKVLALLCIAAGQVYILTGFFKAKQSRYV